jgi:hypothetical protein
MMNKKLLYSLPILAILSGCISQLKPNDDLTNFIISPGGNFSPAELCADRSGTQACLRMKNGKAVNTVLQGDLSTWLRSLSDDQATDSESSKQFFSLNSNTGHSLLIALIKDNRQRELKELKFNRQYGKNK